MRPDTVHHAEDHDSENERPRQQQHCSIPDPDPDPRHDQNLIRVRICTRRIGRAAVTSPKVGELITVSIDANWMVFSRLFASTWSESERLAPRLILRVSPALRTDVPGPMIVLRPAVPKVPGAGIENAAVLKKSSAVGSLTVIGCAAVVGAQRTVRAAADVADARQNGRSERRAGRELHAAVDLPAAEQGGSQSRVEPASFAPNGSS